MWRLRALLWRSDCRNGAGREPKLFSDLMRMPVDAASDLRHNGLISNGRDQMTKTFDARRDQMLRELASDLADLVSSGDMTEAEANEWMSSKADQWSADWFN
jgi:hypothetical protein